MGGIIAETIIKKDGTILKMARKTGAYNWMFFSKEFNEGNFDKAIENHVEIFNKMREDFLSGEPYEMPMSPVYGWCEETSPIDYGLVVIDFKNKKIYSMQEYDTPGYFHSSMLSNVVVLEKEEKENIDFLIKNNLLEVLEDSSDEYKSLGDVKSFFGNNVDLNKVKKYNNIGIRDFFKPPKRVIFFPKVMSDFEFKRYEETPNGLIDFAKDLKFDGFNFNEVEIKSWSERLKDFDLECFLDDVDAALEECESKAEKNKNKMLKKLTSTMKSSNLLNNKKLKP